MVEVGKKAGKSDSSDLSDESLVKQVKKKLKVPVAEEVSGTRQRL